MSNPSIKIFHSILKTRPKDGVMFIGYAIETLRDEAPRNAASTPPVKAVLAAGYCHDVGEFNGACNVPRDSDCSDGLW